MTKNGMVPIIYDLTIDKYKASILQIWRMTKM